jgi:hypothetical protein
LFKQPLTGCFLQNKSLTQRMKNVLTSLGSFTHFLKH